MSREALHCPQGYLFHIVSVSLNGRPLRLENSPPLCIREGRRVALGIPFFLFEMTGTADDID
jgi:hypothetical protein